MSVYPLCFFCNNLVSASSVLFVLQWDVGGRGGERGAYECIPSLLLL